MGVGEQHHQPIDADAHATGGGHAVPQGTDEIDVHLGHRIFFVEPRQLSAEQFFLQVGIVQLGIGVGHFHALDEQLEPLGDGRVVLFALGKRADARRIVHHKDGTGKGVLYLRLEHFVHHHVGMPPRRLDVQGLRQSGDVRFSGRVHARVLLE